MRQWIDSIIAPVETAPVGKKQVGVIVSAASIIEVMYASRRRMRMTEIARELSIPPSSCYNVLKTLVSENILEFDQNTKTYHAGYGLVSIAQGYLGPGGPLRVVRPLLEEIAHQRRVTLVIWRRSGKHMVVKDFVDDGSPLSVHVEPGARFPLLTGAMGRVIGAYGGLSKREMTRLFTATEWADPLDFDDFLEEVNQTRIRGWSFDPGAFVSAISTISVPIGSAHGPVDAVLSATTFASHFQEGEVQAIADELLPIGQFISNLRVGNDL